MSDNSPLIETVTPERLVGWSMDFIEAGCTGLLVKNGRLVRTLLPGRHFSFAFPWLEQCQLVLVDSKIRNLEIVSNGDFLSYDRCVINVSVVVMYQVVDPQRVALELSDPIVSLSSAVKDALGIVISQLNVEQLTTQGRTKVRQYLLEHSDVAYNLGFNLEDVRVNDISFPETAGIIRQVEGMSARQQAEHQAALQAEIARAGRPDILPPPVQQVNIVPGKNPATIATPEAVAILGSQQSLPSSDRAAAFAPTIFDPNSGGAAVARLVNTSSGAIAILSNTPFTIGREPSNNLIVEDSLCSRHHAKILKITDPQGTERYQLIDVGSSNGTFLDEQRLLPNQPVWLNPENTIRISSQTWKFEA